MRTRPKSAKQLLLDNAAVLSDTLEELGYTIDWQPSVQVRRAGSYAWMGVRRPGTFTRMIGGHAHPNLIYWMANIRVYRDGRIVIWPLHGGISSEHGTPSDEATERSDAEANRAAKELYNGLAKKGLREWLTLEKI